MIDGQRKDAITMQGAQNITLENLDVKNGNNGIVANGGAYVTLTNIAVRDNALIGILLESNSSAVVSGGGSRHNGLNGIDLEASSSLIVQATAHLRRLPQRSACGFGSAPECYGMPLPPVGRNPLSACRGLRQEAPFFGGCQSWLRLVHEIIFDQTVLF
jgi:hypothetical protein